MPIYIGPPSCTQYHECPHAVYNCHATFVQQRYDNILIQHVLSDSLICAYLREELKPGKTLMLIDVYHYVNISTLRVILYASP